MMHKPSRNDQCYCGSGSKYKNCHKAIDDANLAEKYNVAQEVYLSKWKNTSASHEREGHYAWMANLVTKYQPKLILDIGCGTGRGVLTLLRQSNPDVTMISVDENPACITEAEKYLTAHGLIVNTVRRIRVQPNLQWQHFDVFHDVVIPPLLTPGCNLIESNFCDDTSLVSFFQMNARFDLITVWLIGTHFLRKEAGDVKGKIGSDGEYRLYVQNAVYEIADKLLRSGGILNVVDRGQALVTEELKEDVLRAHRDQASVTSLTVEGVEWLPIAWPNSRNGMPMHITPGINGQMPISPELAIISITSRKP